VKGTETFQGITGTRFAGFEHDGAKILSDRPTDGVVSQLQGGAPGAFELQRKQIVT